jgi:hypothetical protein
MFLIYCRKVSSYGLGTEIHTVIDLHYHNCNFSFRVALSTRFRVMACPVLGDFAITLNDTHTHTHTHTHTLGSTPLVEWSVCHRDLYLTTLNTHKTHTSMPLEGFEFTIPASERPKTHVLNRAFAGIGVAAVTPCQLLSSPLKRPDRLCDAPSLLYEVQCVLGGIFPGGKWPGRETDHSPPPGAEVKNEWRCTCTPPLRAFMGCTGRTSPLPWPCKLRRHHSPFMSLNTQHNLINVCCRS